MYLILSLIGVFIGICWISSNLIIKSNSKYYSSDKYKRKILLKIISKEIDDMDCFKFEEFCCKLFNMNGFKAKTTSKTRDGGKDIIVKDDEGTIYIECKHYDTNNKINVNLIHKLISSCAVDNISRGIFITTSTYTKSSLELINKCNIVKIGAWYKEDLLGMCKDIDLLDLLNWLGYSRQYVDDLLESSII